MLITKVINGNFIASIMIVFNGRSQLSFIGDKIFDLFGGAVISDLNHDAFSRQ